MNAPRERQRLGVPLREQITEQPSQDDPQHEADGGGQHEGVHGEQAEVRVGQRGGQAGRLFAVELVAVQLVWFAVL
jgi:hypothetical protein